MGGDLTAAQIAALDALSPIIGDNFYLVGGVAVALYLHHRQSRDLDLFTSSSDPVRLEERLGQLPNAAVMERAEGTLHVEVGGVPVSLLRYRYPMLHEPERHPGIAVPVASTNDLICMKLSAIGGRGARRDFWDLHALLANSRLPLANALELFARKYPNVDRGHIVRALVYFADADAEPMPKALLPAAWDEMRRDFERWVLELDRNS